MSTVYVATSPEDQREIPEDQVRLLWDRGEISHEALYWKPDMPEWRPVREFLWREGSTSGLRLKQSPPPAPAEKVTRVDRQVLDVATDTIVQPGRGLDYKTAQDLAQAQAAVSRGYEFEKNPKKLTLVLLVMLGFCLMGDLAAFVSNLMQLLLLGKAPLGDQEIMLNDLRQQLVGVGYLVVYLTTAVVWCMWVYRANRNCHGFGAEGMAYTPGWAVGYYFVPILNLFRPYQVMKEIWLVSRNPHQWELDSPGNLLGIWWFLWLANNVLGNISWRATMGAENLEQLQRATQLNMFVDLTGVPLCLVAMLMIWTIYRNQKVLVENPA